jgi:hypothetical protein
MASRRNRIPRSTIGSELFRSPIPPPCNAKGSQIPRKSQAYPMTGRKRIYGLLSATPQKVIDQVHRKSLKTRKMTQAELLRMRQPKLPKRYTYEE